MNIVVLTLDYPPRRVIGAELAMHRLVKRLRAAGHRVQVRMLAEGSQRFEGVTAVSHKTRGVWNPDVVITNAGLGTRVRNTWPDVPRVVWAHNNQVGAILDVKESDPHILIANTRHMRDVFLSTNGQDSMVLYPIPDPTVTELDELGSCVTLINGSREKGGRVVAEAAPLLPTTEFLVVRGGHGPQVPQVASNVETIEHQKNMTSVWRRTRILIIPSHLESYSMVGFEAIQRGIPTIGRRLPGVLEALGERETWVRSRDPEDWAQAIATHSDTRHARDSRRAHVALRHTEVREQVTELLERLEAI